MQAMSQPSHFCVMHVLDGQAEAGCEAQTTMTLHTLYQSITYQSNQQQRKQMMRMTRRRDDDRTGRAEERRSNG